MKFDVDEKEANLILQALVELPAKMSIGLTSKLQGQAQSQLNESGAECVKN